MLRPGKLTPAELADEVPAKSQEVDSGRPGRSSGPGLWQLMSGRQESGTLSSPRTRGRAGVPADKPAGVRVRGPCQAPPDGPLPLPRRAPGLLRG